MELLTPILLSIVLLGIGVVIVLLRKQQSSTHNDLYLRQQQELLDTQMRILTDRLDLKITDMFERTMRMEERSNKQIQASQEAIL